MADLDLLSLEEQTVLLWVVELRARPTTSKVGGISSSQPAREHAGRGAMQYAAADRLSSEVERAWREGGDWGPGHEAGR